MLTQPAYLILMVVLFDVLRYRGQGLWELGGDGAHGGRFP
jgi:hypothetical protein